MTKEVYIIPGYGMSTTGRHFIKIEKFFIRRKIKPFMVNISWKYKNMGDYINQFNDFYEQNHRNGNEVILFGFSWGAMIAFISSLKVKSQLQILCSLSPYFKEDLKYLPKAWAKGIGSKRLKNFEEFSFNKIAKNNKDRIILIAGENENKSLLKRVNKGYSRLNNSRLIIIEKAKHKLDEIYLASLKKIISKL